MLTTYNPGKGLAGGLIAISALRLKQSSLPPAVNENVIGGAALMPATSAGRRVSTASQRGWERFGVGTRSAILRGEEGQ